MFLFLRESWQKVRDEIEETGGRRIGQDTSSITKWIPCCGFHIMSLQMGVLSFISYTASYTWKINTPNLDSNIKLFFCISFQNRTLKIDKLRQFNFSLYHFLGVFEERKHRVTSEHPWHWTTDYLGRKPCTKAWPVLIVKE